MKKNTYTKLVTIEVYKGWSWTSEPREVFLWGKEIHSVSTECISGKVVSGVDTPTTDSHDTYVAAIFSYRRSRAWNIKSLADAIDRDWIREGFFEYHPEQLRELFGNKTRYLTAMREIERRLNLPRGYCYKPQYLASAVE